MATMILLFLSLLMIPTSFCLNQEGLYLQSVKVALFDPTGALSDWNPRDETPCNWTGITCDPQSHSVKSIDLSSTSLSGPFPIFLCSLPSLSTLSLFNNNINSSIPSSISSCRNLTHLDLSQNLLEGTIPDTLPDIPNLTHLLIDANSLSGGIPASFGQFRRLETLSLTSNLLNGTIPGSLGDISTLKELNLAYNLFPPSRIPPELGNLSNVEKLFLSSSNFVGQVPDSFSGLSKISSIDLSNNFLNGSIPSVIFQLTTAFQIELYNNSFTGEIPAAGWSNLTALRRFDASMNELTGIIPDELCELPLGSLQFFMNQLVGPIPESLARSPNLYEIRLFNNKLNGSLPSQLGQNSPLHTLDVSYNQLSGKIPPNLCEKGEFSELVLISNLFSGEIPATLTKCRSLGRIRLSSNRLEGEVPAEFWGLPHVYFLDLADNSFSGNISSMIHGAFNLSSLWISKNGFSGGIPHEIGSLGKLIELLGGDNRLSGQLPESLIHLSNLESLDFSNNDISGGIPLGIQSLKQLNELNLANNSLSGEIPDEIGNLPVLNYLDLSENSFSGKIPHGLQNLKLNELNLSYNHLIGPIPSAYAKEVYSDSFLGNPGLCGDLAGLCERKGIDKQRRDLWILRLIFIIAGVVLVAGVAWFLFKYRYYKKSNKGVIITKWRSFHRLGFSEREILDCLKEDNAIGSGSSGKVYKAILSNGETVAVKKLWERSIKDDDMSFTSVGSEKDEFESEVQTLGKIRHKNIVRLWCCCKTGNAKLLVYEYMPNGSLGDLLHSSKGGLLDWPTRFRIALDAAEGLSYLHHDCVSPIIHRDVKSNNILLDGDFGARIADFGVAKMIEVVNKGPESMSVIAGSCGYIAPEYAYTLRVNEKSDTYSFGVVILELVTGKQPIDPEFGDKDLATWVCTTVEQKGRDHVVDPNLDSSCKEQVYRVLDIGLLCISPLPINRPSMRKVVKMLQEAGMNNRLKFAQKDGTLSPYYNEDVAYQATLV